LNTYRLNHYLIACGVPKGGKDKYPLEISINGKSLGSLSYLFAGSYKSEQILRKFQFLLLYPY